MILISYMLFKCTGSMGDNSKRTEKHILLFCEGTTQMLGKVYRWKYTLDIFIFVSFSLVSLLLHWYIQQCLTFVTNLTSIKHILVTRKGKEKSDHEYASNIHDVVIEEEIDYEELMTTIIPRQSYKTCYQASGPITSHYIINLY